jgi:bifunctional non-homologous end joining protein LigD
LVAETDEVLAATRERGLEGVVAKRRGSLYLPGVRNGAWVKHKHRRTESFLVSGWSPPERRRPESLLRARAGLDGSLEPAGSVPLVLADGHANDVRRQLERLVLPPTPRSQRIRRLEDAMAAGWQRKPLQVRYAPLRPW